MTDSEKKGNSTEEQLIAHAVQSWHNQSEFTFHTSGSTGIPKEISFTKDQVKASISKSQEAFGLTSEDTALLCLPMRYVAGKMMLFRALHINMDLIAAEPKINLNQVYDKEVSFAAFIPPQVENILSTDQGVKWLSSIRVILIGGGPINQVLESKLKDFDNDIYHTYGMTETLTHIATKKLSKGGSSSYQPLPNIHLSNDDDGALRIEAKHLNVTLATNDIVELRTDQSFKILGRKDHVINSGGLKIHPEELESIFKKHLSQDLIIKGLPDDRLGEKVTLVIESQKAVDPEWLNVAMHEIEKAKRPKKILYMDQFPRTESGKVRRSLIN